MKTPASTALILGVIVCYSQTGKYPPFSEAPFFLQLAKEGKMLGLDIFVFNPRHVNWNTRTVTGWHVTPENRWATSRKPLPSLIYDRCYYLNSEHYMKYKPFVQKLAQDTRIRLLGRALGGKLQTYEMLKQNPAFASFLPLTIRYQSPHNVIRFLRERKEALIKPNGGSHGRGVVAISRTPEGFWVRGRTQGNQPFESRIPSEEGLAHWLDQFTQNTRYIIQPLLLLTTPDKCPFDLRILVQKNEKREWEMTGMAVRTGQPGSITSNLHGGGHAVKLHDFLNTHYPASLIPSILEKIRQISYDIPPYIEEIHGPLVELGLDIGIDREGNVWLLEVNSKPGRSVFIQTGELEIRRRAVQLPIRYAHALLTS